MSSYNCCQSNTLENQSILAQLDLLKLLAEQSRLQLMCVLRNDSHCVSELLEHVDQSQSLVSHHLRDLKDAGLVSAKKDGRNVYYSLTNKGKQVTQLLLVLADRKQI